MQSLKDKLLKAGLVSEADAKRAEAEKKAPPPKPERAPERREARPARRDDDSRIPKLAPMAGSKEANRQLARQQQQTDRAIREKVQAAEVPVEPGATVFYFVTRKNKLRRLELSEAQAAKLQAGELAVVERPDPDKIEHALVPPAVAEELLALSEKAVRFMNKQGAAVGFLSDEEIHQRATEADVPEESAPAAAQSAEPAGTFITIKRAPKP
ncbi:MAG: hypothetical protein AMXMBFR34_18260 [Myxococcaceae bacterium]